MAAPVVGIVGAKALRKDLNRLTTDVKSPLYQAMREAGKEAVGPIVTATQARLPRVETRQHPAGTLAGTVRASGTRTGAAVRMGTAKIRYAGPVDFGGYPRPGGEHRGKARWRGGAFRLASGEEVEGGRPFIPTGRYLYPAARELAPRAAADYSRALTELFAQPGIWTNTTSSPGGVHD